ncbi:MAG: serine peptidase, partial [Xanthobacteraceae bacterium]
MRRALSRRRAALLATTIAGLGAAALLLAPITAPKFDVFGATAQAQNLSEKARQIEQKPVGFADIVEKVKPAVISVRVKIDRPASSHPDGDQEIPFPPNSPFQRFFKRFGMPNVPDMNSGPEVI